MTNRTLIALTAALLVFGALALMGQREEPGTGAGSAFFLPGLQEQLDEIGTVRVTGAGGRVLATLERGASGWTVRERDGFPADLQKVRHTLLSLAEARILESKTANPEWHHRLGVEDVQAEDAGGVAVTLTGADEPVEVIVGESVGDYQAYVRRTGEAQSYLVDRDPEVGSSATDWLSGDILSIAGDRIQRVTVTHPDGEILSVFKDDTQQMNFHVENIPEGRELQYESVANVMGSVLSNLNLEDVEAFAEDDAPATVTEFRTFDGLVVTAESVEREDQAWVSFRVRYEAPASPASEEQTDGTQELSAGESVPDPETEARELNDRLRSWRYRIASYQADQMTRRMTDLLRSLPESS